MTSGLHLLQLATVRWYNAAAEYAVRLSAGLAERGHRVVFGGFPGSPVLKAARDEGLHVLDAFDFRPGRFDNPATLLRFRQYLKASRFHLINAHRAEDHLFAALATIPGRNIPVVRTRGDVRLPKRSWSNRLLYERHTDAHIMAAGFMRQRFYGFFRLRSENLALIPPGIDLDKFRRDVPERVSARLALDLPPHRPTIGIIGRFTAVKGHTHALEAFARVHRAFPNVQFVVAGEPYEVSEGFLRERADHLGLGGAIRFLPRLGDVRRLIAALDVGVIASTASEAICRVALEYMSLGVPVVGTDLNSIPEMVVHGSTGLIVPPGRPEEMGNALLRLLREPTFRERLGDAGPGHVRKNYDADRMIEATETLYGRLIPGTPDMKILIATQDYPPVPGGMSRVYADIAAGFPEGSCGVSTTAAVGEGESPPPHVPVRRQNFPLARAHRPASIWRWTRDLHHDLRERRPDVLLCGNLRPLGPPCWHVARRAGLPFYIMVHGNDLLTTHRRWSGWRRPVWRAVTGGASGWIANSRAVLKLGTDRGLDASRGFVLHPEVNNRRFVPAAPGGVPPARREFGLPGQVLLALFVGRLVRRKGLDRLIEALAVAGAPWHLAVTGYGDDTPYRALADGAGVAGRVHFLGAVDGASLPHLYQAADILAMPSRTIEDRSDVEGFGIVYLEAAASGLPSLAGRSGGAPEAVRHQETGLVVDGESTVDIAAALDALADADRRGVLGSAARARVDAELGPGSMAKRWMERLIADRNSGLWKPASSA